MNKKIISLVIMIIIVCNFNSTIASISDTNNQEHFVKVPILVYHNIMDDYPPAVSALHISPQEFENHIFALYKAGYNTITFEQYYDYVQHGEELPEKPIIITFDDGYLSNYEYAFPILKRYQMKATILIITDRRGATQPRVTYQHFTWEQAREMQESGLIDIQSHSHTHADMTRLEWEEAFLDLRRSRYIIEKEMGRPCTVFAYPYGLYNEQLQEMARKAGYKMQLIVGDRGVNTKHTDIRQIKRLTAFGGTTGQELLQMIEENMQIGK